MRFRPSPRYVCTPGLVDAVNASITLGRPLLLRGEPGTGKTALAGEIAQSLALPLLRWHLKSSSRAQQGLYEYDVVARLRDAQLGEPRARDIANYIVHGVLWRAFAAETPSVVLIDGIDKADIEFPNDLLRELDRMECHCHETGETVRARARPVVVVTANAERDLPDAFLRRCFFHHMSFPNPQTMGRILDAHQPRLRLAPMLAGFEGFLRAGRVDGLLEAPSPDALEAALRGIDGGARRHGLLVDFLYHLRKWTLPVSTGEFLALADGLQRGVAGDRIEQFYFLARAALVKDESRYDRFDRAFDEFFRTATGDFRAVETVHALEQLEDADAPAQLAPLVTGDVAEPVDARDELRRAFGEYVREQKQRHQGGSRWRGSSGSSRFGNSGYHPAGMRIGGESAGNRTEAKVWGQRSYRNLDGSLELGTRNIKVALRRLRRFAREGAAEELDLEATIAGTARNAGWLDLRLRPERHNKIKLLLFLDIGGSMDDHIRLCEELFSAAKSEFRHMEFFYFHNCVYESVWRDNRRRGSERIGLHEVLHTYGRDYKLVFVGDATMGRNEITAVGGAVEHHNTEPGETWLRRMLDTWPAAAWLNPVEEHAWESRPTIGMIRGIVQDRMYPLNLPGLDAAMRQLAR